MSWQSPALVSPPTTWAKQAVGGGEEGPDTAVPEASPGARAPSVSIDGKTTITTSSQPSRAAASSSGRAVSSLDWPLAKRTTEGRCRPRTGRWPPRAGRELGAAQPARGSPSPGAARTAQPAPRTAGRGRSPERTAGPRTTAGSSRDRPIGWRRCPPRPPPSTTRSLIPGGERSGHRSRSKRRNERPQAAPRDEAQTAELHHQPLITAGPARRSEARSLFIAIYSYHL